MKYYILDSDWANPARIKQEREKAKKLKKTSWWRAKLNQGVCHYCEQKFLPNELTMDHVVPIARGGSSVPGNVVPACQKCNQSKKLDTPVDQILESLKNDGNDQ